MSSICPCSSGKTYCECCKPFHQGQEVQDAVSLVRARFSAYALGLVDYIIQTTHPAHPHYQARRVKWQEDLRRFCSQGQFIKLDILQSKQFANTGCVLFTAHLVTQGRDGTFTERSYFEKLHGKWFYRGGNLIEGHMPHSILEEEFQILPIAYYGDPILRVKTLPVTEITKDIQELVTAMIHTMDSADGVGLAAPQVHYALQLFIIRTPSQGIKRSEVTWGDVQVFLNAKLSHPSAEMWEAEEGCLSIPGIRVCVKRPKSIMVDYMTLDGTMHHRQVQGWEARAIMHEYDHISGVLFVDRVSPQEKKRLAPWLSSLQARMHDDLLL